MSKHTPGPWSVVNCPIGGPSICANEGKTTVADIRTTGGVHCGGPQHQQTMANADLIAAAPDLLNVLQLLVRPHGGTVAVGADNELAIKARAAIAKATGEQK